MSYVMQFSYLDSIMFRTLLALSYLKLHPRLKYCNWKSFYSLRDRDVAFLSRRDGTDPGRWCGCSAAAPCAGGWCCAQVAPVAPPQSLQLRKRSEVKGEFCARRTEFACLSSLRSRDFFPQPMIQNTVANYLLLLREKSQSIMVKMTEAVRNTSFSVLHCWFV